MTSIPGWPRFGPRRRRKTSKTKRNSKRKCESSLWQQRRAQRASKEGRANQKQGQTRRDRGKPENPPGRPNQTAKEQSERNPGRARGCKVRWGKGLTPEERAWKLQVALKMKGSGKGKSISERVKMMERKMIAAAPRIILKFRICQATEVRAPCCPPGRG